MSGYSDQIERLRDPISSIVQDYESWDGPFEPQMLPAKQVIADIKDQRDRSLYLTLTVSVNYLRDAAQLWDKTKALWVDNRWVFEPADLVQEGEEALSELFSEYGFRFPNKDAGIWYGNASTLYRNFDSNPLNLFKAQNFDAEQILNYVGRSGDFSYLGGQKIGPLWMRLIHEDVHSLSKIEKVSIPVDTQIRKITNALLAVNYSDDEIRQFWMRFCRETGMDPVKVDQPLWLIGNNWESWGREYLRSQVSELLSDSESTSDAVPNGSNFKSKEEWIEAVASPSDRRSISHIREQMSNATKVTEAKRFVEILYQLRPGDKITYKASGGGREGPVNVRVSEVGERDGTYCIFGEWDQGGEYVLFPDGRPSGQKYEPPEACYISGAREAQLSNMGLATHGTLQWLRVDSKVIDRVRES